MDSKLRAIIEKLNKAAKGTIAITGDEAEKVDVIPTGILPLDLALGIGGIPRGRITDLYSLPSVGKSTICYTVIANAQKQGLSCAIVDAENSYSTKYVERFGVDTANLIVITPNTLEEGGDAIETLIREGIGLIVVDSVSSLVPLALAEAGMEKAPMAMQARGISQMLLKITVLLKKSNTALVTINQMRANIMAMHPGDKYIITGGWSLKFYASLRIEMKRLKGIANSKGVVTGYFVRFTVKKNKLAKPGGVCEVIYDLEKGFEKEGDLVSLAIEVGAVSQSGAFYIMNEVRYRGKDKLAETINADPQLKQSLRERLYAQTAL